jgi:hypothetical protein
MQSVQKSVRDLVIQEKFDKSHEVFDFSGDNKNIDIIILIDILNSMPWNQFFVSRRLSACFEVWSGEWAKRTWSFRSARKAWRENYTFARSDFFACIFQTAGLDCILYIV